MFIVLRGCNTELHNLNCVSLSSLVLDDSDVRICKQQKLSVRTVYRRGRYREKYQTSMLNLRNHFQFQMLDVTQMFLSKKLNNTVVQVADKRFHSKLEQWSKSVTGLNMNRFHVPKIEHASKQTSTDQAW